MKTTRRQLFAFATVSALSVALAGCGGGGSDSTPTGTGPSATTRSRVLSLHSNSLRGMTQAGFRNDAFAMGLNSLAPGAPEMAAGGAASAADQAAAILPYGAVPFLGAFLRNVAAQPPVGRAAKVRSLATAAKTRRVSRDETVPEPPILIEPAPAPEPDPNFDPSFYFDYYLGLWTEVVETSGQTTYRLYEDEAKTQPAGSIEVTEPADFDTYPQVYRSSYSFTAGYLAGAHGSAQNTNNADGSGQSSYENVYADSSSDRGQSNWSSRGDFSGTSRTDGPGDAWTEGNTTFRSDGSGAMRYSSSDGYRSDYVYNANGSGHGRIEGPDPGLPVTITWDAYGNTTIRYADGTVETYPGWGIGFAGGGSGDGGTTGSSGSGVAVDSGPDEPVASPAKG